jgi:hypothetical protein
LRAGPGRGETVHVSKHQDVVQFPILPRQTMRSRLRRSSSSASSAGPRSPRRPTRRFFDRAVVRVADVARKLVDSLVTQAPPRDREVEAEKARARAATLGSLGHFGIRGPRRAASRVAGGDCSPPALTEPDLWTTHPALQVGVSFHEQQELSVRDRRGRVQPLPFRPEERQAFREPWVSIGSRNTR